MEVPHKILETFESLRKSEGSGLILRKIKDGFYVYREKGIWVKELKKSKPKFEYLGSITELGIFKKKRITDLENAKLVIQSYGGKVLLPEKIEDQNTISTSIEDNERRIFTILSMNGRATLKLISKMTGIPKATAYDKKKRLEEKYGIRYFADIDAEKLGYQGYLIFVKFHGKMPNSDEIRAITKNDPHIQLAALTAGRYDLMLYILSKSHRDVAYFVYELRSKTPLKNYSSLWYTTPHYSRRHIIPLRDECFGLFAENIWKGTKEKPHQESNELNEREYNVLRELNHNGVESFTDIDKKYGYGIGTSRYTYLRLKERGVLRNITITLDRLPKKYTAILFVDVINMKQLDASRPRLLFEAIKDTPLTNKYAITGDIGTPQSYVLAMPVFNDGDLSSTEEDIKKKISGIRLRKMIITDEVAGSLCYRRLDSTYTNQYKLLVEEYKTIKPTKQVDYTELE